MKTYTCSVLRHKTYSLRINIKIPISHLKTPKIIQGKFGIIAANDIRDDKTISKSIIHADVIHLSKQVLRYNLQHTFNICTAVPSHSETYVFVMYFLFGGFSLPR